MSETILLITFRLNVAPSAYEQVVAPLAQTIADIVGLRWKIWLVNPAQSAASVVPVMVTLKPSPFARSTGPHVST